MLNTTCAEFQKGIVYADYRTSINRDENMHTGQFIKQTVSKGNSVDRKNKSSNGTYKFSTINQSPLLLKPSLPISGFSKSLFFKGKRNGTRFISFILSSLEQACLVNGVD